jgi:uncharacterized damage-inducible protein DinB
MIDVCVEGSNHPAVRRPENIVLASAGVRAASLDPCRCGPVVHRASLRRLTARRLGYAPDVARSPLADAFAHHAWATLRLLDACASLDAAGLATSVPGTYGPILATLRHIVASDRSYLALLTDEVEDVDEDALDLATMREVTEADATVWQRVIARDVDPGEVIVRDRDDGSESHAPLGMRLAQVVHHGTDHRSQVCTALTSLGVEPPQIDVWGYASSLGRLREVAAPGTA